MTLWLICFYTEYVSFRWKYRIGNIIIWIFGVRELRYDLSIYDVAILYIFYLFFDECNQIRIFFLSMMH